MPQLTVDGVDLEYLTMGEGPPLVLVHGSGTDSTTWDGVVDELAQDFEVTVYDRRGYGRSLHKPVRDHRVHARDLTAVLEQVVRRPAVVVGWSSGGNVGLATAAARPDLFVSLVVVEAPLHGLRHPDRQVLATAAKLKATQLRGRKVEAAEVFFRFGSALRSGANTYDNAPDEVRANLRANALPVLAEWDPHPFGVMHEHLSLTAVAGIPVDVTWVLGGESSPWMASLHRHVVRRRPATRTVTIAGAGHLAHIDQPERFVAVIRDAARPSVE